MNWMSDQITERREADQQALEEAFQRIAGVVLGERIAEKLSDDRIITKQTIDDIFKYYHLKPVDIPESIKDPNEQIDYYIRHYGFLKRTVELNGKWYSEAYGPMLGYLEESGTPVALLPGVYKGYYYIDNSTGEKVKINSKTAAKIGVEAICFYRPMPLKKLGIMDLILYMRRCVNAEDSALLILAAFAVACIGLLFPRISAALTGPVLSSGEKSALIGAAISVLCISLSSQVINSLRELLSKRVEMKINVGVDSAMMMRILSLPVSFFREYSPGELKNRARSVSTLCGLMREMILTTGLTSVASLVYITQIVHFAPALAFTSIIIILLTVCFSIAVTMMNVMIRRKVMLREAKEAGLSYSLITGVQKIKLAGAEKRVFARWLNIYAGEAELKYNPPLFLKISSVITTGISLFSTILLYFLAVQNGIDQSSYFAFTAAYGSVMGAFTALSGIAGSAADVKPILEMAEPFLQSVPEISTDREIVTSISGRVELDHVSFRYSDSTPYILDDVSLMINPGEYVAIVGRTGCGKSTLIRLLLGFEKPEKGAVYYDNKDVSSLDPGSLRNNIGTVTQNGGLFQGDIYSNIVITAPWLTVDDAWEAAEKAGIADDIRSMPMGMYTLISEGHGGVSGGQRQRLMIARAIAPKPKLLIFDEATSALDNKTQKQVSDSLDSMGCTRIVVAHRLSTIRHCDRIVVLDRGHIIEDGTYEELIAKQGFFAELVERQRLDTVESIKL